MLHSSDSANRELLHITRRCQSEACRAYYCARGEVQQEALEEGLRKGFQCMFSTAEQWVQVQRSLALLDFFGRAKRPP